MADRTVLSLLASGLRTKGADVVTSMRGPLYELSGVGLGLGGETSPGAWQRQSRTQQTVAAMQFAPVYACVTRIAADIAKLGLRLMSRGEDGIWTEAPNGSPFRGALRKPNPFQTQIQFVELWQIAKAMHGNAYALKERDERGVVRRLYPLDPRRVVPLVSPTGEVFYSLAGDDLARVPTGGIVPATEIIHDRGPCLWHPLVGIAPLYACALAAQQGMAIQQNGQVFFANMSRPSGMLTAPGTIPQETADRLKREFERNYGGLNVGRLAVLGDGLKYEAMTIPAEAAQLIEQLRWTAEDVARAYGMPLYKIGAGPMPTANNVQALQQQYLSDCLQVHIESMELCLDEGLALPDGLRTEVDLANMLRMDTPTQVDVLAKAVGGALMKPDEARGQLNLPRVPGGDSVYLQQQNYSLAALAKRDASDDPFAGDPVRSRERTMRTRREVDLVAAATKREQLAESLGDPMLKRRVDQVLRTGDASVEDRRAAMVVRAALGFLKDARFEGAEDSIEGVYEAISLLNPASMR